MYIYDEYDQRIVEDRARQFRDQVRRYLAGELSETEFLPLRLQNGLYVQRYAPMLRIAVPYGVLSSQRLRKLAYITRRYDKGYAHITTRQNIQLNWPNLEDVRSEEHTSELQSRPHLVCRLLLEKKKTKITQDKRESQTNYLSPTCASRLLWPHLSLRPSHHLQSHPLRAPTFPPVCVTSSGVLPR